MALRILLLGNDVMKRWQLWTSLVAGLLSVGGPGSYFGWRYFARISADEVIANLQEGSTSSAAQPPSPIPVSDNDPSPAFNPIAPASFNEGSSDSGPARNKQSDFAPPARPSASFNSGNEPLQLQPANDGSPEALPTQPSYGGSFSDQPPAYTQMPAARIVTPGVKPPGELPADQPANAPGRNILTDATDPNVTDASEVSAAQAPRKMSDSSDVVQQPANDFPAGPPTPNPNRAADVLPLRQGLDRIPSAPVLPQSKPTVGSARSRLSGDANLPAIGEESAAAIRGQIPRMTARDLTNPGADSTLTSDAPGERKLEGMQTPMLSLEKTAPEEIQVGKVAKFTIRVRNVGQTAAHGVVVTDRVPQGTEFVESVPQAIGSRDGGIMWELGTLQPGEESIVTLDLMPQSEGEIGSVAQVTLHAQAAVRTIATRPMLTIEHSGPAKVLIGEDVPFHITVSNPGSGVATGVVIEVDVPTQLAHEGGREIMSDRFDLRPNETRKLDLVLKAVQPGVVENVVRAVADANQSAEHRTQLEVVAPRLQIAVSGPTKRFLQRQVTYQIAVTNPGTASAMDIELVAHMPQGLKFVGTDKKGEYDQRKHAVYWGLEELPAGETSVVQLSALPIDTGDQKLHLEGHAALDLSANYDHTTVVEALTELVFSVSDENDPIEVGAETSYEVRVTNNGSKAATNVQVAAQLPPEMMAIKADGPTKAQIQGQQIVMEPLAQLAPREEIVYRIAVKGRKAGDHLIRVQIISDEFPTPVTKEESTKVYADE